MPIKKPAASASGGSHSSLTAGPNTGHTARLARSNACVETNTSRHQTSMAWSAIGRVRREMLSIIDSLVFGDLSRRAHLEHFATVVGHHPHDSLYDLSA